ncbi:lamin tail domain-containing protein [bacterium]|nr:lamin tail domain-containing protein [bacterium]
MKKIVTLVMVLILCFACGLTKKLYPKDENTAFYVTEVSPEANEEVSLLKTVALKFSQAVYEESVNNNTVFVIKRSVYEEYSDWNDLYADVQNGDVIPVSQSVALADDKSSVSLQVSEEVLADDYVIVALPKIQSDKYYPLDQTVMGWEEQSFHSRFAIIGSADGAAVDVSVNEGSSYPETPDVAETTEEIVEEPFDWNRLLITEVVTDPQQDHSESEGGNGVLFDGVPGTGTIGSTDEYIELYNGTDDVVDLSLFGLNMEDGTNEFENLIDVEDRLFSLDGSLDYFSPGEFLVLGNPEGALNNSISIELWDENGDVVDSVAIEDANATGLDDEAYYRDVEGEWGQGMASPGGFLDI